MERTVSLAGDPNIGVFMRVFEDIAVIPPETPAELRAQMKEALSVELVETTIQGSPIIGSLLAGNSRAFVVSGLVTEAEAEVLSRYRPLVRLEHTMNAAGNIILANDSFAAVHPDMPSDLMKEVGAALEVPVIRLTCGGIKTVGMAAVATNKGIIVHPRSTRMEIKKLEDAVDIPVGTGTVNMGTGLVGTGLLVNSKGYLAGLATSGFELGRIEDVFGFLE
jgi:translation initiation factor 6